DFTERQLGLATNVEERIRLLRAYTGALVALSALFLMAAAAAIWGLANARPPSLMILAAGGMIAAIGRRIQRPRPGAQHAISAPPTFPSASDDARTAADPLAAREQEN